MQGFNLPGDLEQLDNPLRLMTQEAEEDSNVGDAVVL